jgi:hypothetical protein
VPSQKQPFWLGVLFYDDGFALAPTLQFHFNNPTMLINLTPAQLRQAASIKEQIEALNKELGAIAGISAPTNSTKPVKKGGMSAAGKARIVAAQKLRWSKAKAAKGKSAVKAAVEPAKKKISAEGIARIKAAQKARWAVIKAKTAPKAAVVAKPVVKAAVKPAKKFTMSAAAKAKISAAAKARWAKIRAAKKK